jgi:hypothetical protein
MRSTIGRLLLGATLFAGCTDRELLVPSATPGLAAAGYDGAAQSVEGEAGGARYALFVPTDWNGDLVLYAHGFRDAATPVDLRDQDGFYAVRDRLLAQG